MIHMKEALKGYTPQNFIIRLLSPSRKVDMGFVCFSFCLFFSRNKTYCISKKKKLFFSFPIREVKNVVNKWLIFSFS